MKIQDNPIPGGKSWCSAKEFPPFCFVVRSCLNLQISSQRHTCVQPLHCFLSAQPTFYRAQKRNAKQQAKEIRLEIRTTKGNKDISSWHQQLSFIPLHSFVSLQTVLAFNVSRLSFITAFYSLNFPFPLFFRDLSTPLDQTFLGFPLPVNPLTLLS